MFDWYFTERRAVATEMRVSRQKSEGLPPPPPLPPDEDEELLLDELAPLDDDELEEEEEELEDEEELELPESWTTALVLVAEPAELETTTE
jgi:hypothetical protein